LKLIETLKAVIILLFWRAPRDSFFGGIMENNTKSVCFTGHRKMKTSPKLEKTLADTLKELIEKENVTTFYAGGAVGWDTICAKTVIRLKKEYPFIKLALILPCPAEEQTKLWSEDNKTLYYKILNHADSVECVSGKYFTGCMKLRNERLVLLSDICVCYFDGSSKSGTSQTVRIATECGLQIINLF